MRHPSLRILYLAVFMSAAGALEHSGQDGLPIRYMEDQRAVSLLIALDECEVWQHPGSPIASANVPGARMISTMDNRVRVAFPHLASRREFEMVAAQLAAGGDICAIAYNPEEAYPQPRVLTHNLAVRIPPGGDAEVMARAHHLHVVERPSWAANWCIMTCEDSSPLASVDAAEGLMADGSTPVATPLLARMRSLRGDPNDPLLSQQWHLKNTGQIAGAIAGNDINVSPVWDPATGLHGEGVNIAIVDQGLATDHPDLAANSRTDISININDGGFDPRPINSNENHATVVAGLAAACGNNGIGVTGVAYHAGLVGVRLLAAPITDQQEAQAMAWQANALSANDQVSVSNNSWGGPDDGLSIDGPGPLMAAALVTGTSSGRGGRGTVYAWAGGNGGSVQGTAPGFVADNASFDGFANSRYAIAVAASDSAGRKESYSEIGCCIALNAPGGNIDNVEGIISTDRVGTAGYNAGDYTTPSASSAGGGTSFATPLVVGVAALVLEARTQLTWRDVQQVLFRTATKNDPTDPGWFLTGGGLNFNLAFGFGRVNAAAAVTLARTWTLIPVEAPSPSMSEHVNQAIPDPPSPTATLVPLVRTLEVAAPADFRIERVLFTVDITHPYRGDLSFDLTSPAGTVSHVPNRPLDNNANLVNWTFLTNACWGEHANGTWTLAVTDNYPGDAGRLNSWQISIHGYEPYAAPTLVSINPDGIAPGSPDTVLVISGTGFATDGNGVSTMTTATWNGVPIAATVLNPTHLQVTVPSGIIGGFGTAALLLNNPSVLGEGGGVGSFSVPIDNAPTISAIPDVSLFLNQAGSVTFTIGDVESPVTNLTTTVSVDEGPIAASSLMLGGSGNNRTLAFRPMLFAKGISPVTVAVSDGQRTTKRLFHVVVHDDNPGCGLGGALSLLMGLMMLFSLRRQFSHRV